MISPEKIAEIRERTDILSVIGERVSLRRAGTSHIGLCPFHGEKTPSFHVSPAKQFFYCFGCQKSGDVFRFLMDLDGHGFIEVAEELARRAGVTIDQTVSPTRSLEQRSDRNRIVRINELAAEWFASQLSHSTDAQAYVKERGVSSAVQQEFRLGYAPPKWDGLVRHLQTHKISIEWMEKAGLAIRHPDGRVYDRFRQRLVFPVANSSGEIIAFGGRILPIAQTEKTAKYINSPETLLYKKGEHLYGLNVARDAIRQKSQVVLVEGNFDVLSLHQHQIAYAVAPMGTALTDSQVRMLKRLVGPDGQIILMLDGDRAGRQALLKDIWLLYEHNMKELVLLTENQVDVRVVMLPNGEDPDTWIRKDPEAFKKTLDMAQPAVDYLIDRMIFDLRDGGISEKAKVFQKMAPLLRSVQNGAALDLYIMKLASNLGLDRNWIVQQLQMGTKGAEPAGSLSTQSRKKPVVSDKLFDSTLRSLVALIGDHPTLVQDIPEDVLDRIQHPLIVDVLREAKHKYVGQNSFQAIDFIDLCPLEVRPMVAAAIFSGTFRHVDDPQRALDSICHSIRIRFFRRELEEVKEQMSLAYKQKNQSQVLELSKRMQELVQLTTNFLDVDPKKSL